MFQRIHVINNSMNRRNFLKTSSTFLAAAALPGVPALSSEPLAPVRFNLPINRGWRYSPRKVEGAETVEAVIAPSKSRKTRFPRAALGVLKRRR